MKLSDHPSQEELAFLLGQEDFSDVFNQADAVRREAVGDIIHIRSILEFSNYCRRQCRYCGINCNNSRIAVSYTHLDVYKRQLLSTGFTLFSGNTTGSII